MSRGDTVNQLKSQDFIAALQNLWTGLWSLFEDLGRDVSPRPCCAPSTTLYMVILLQRLAVKSSTQVPSYRTQSRGQGFVSI